MFSHFKIHGFEGKGILQMGTAQALLGVSMGYNFSTAITKEEETRQGKNYYQSSAFQAMQITQLSSVGAKLSNLILENGYARLGTNLAITGTSLAGWVFCPMLAAARQGHLKQAVPAMKSHLPAMINFLPDELDKETENWLGSFSEHIGTISKISMLLGTIALSTAGSTYLASGLLVPITYQAVDSRGLVPRKISLFIENYMPVVANSGVFLGGGLVSQGVGVAQVLSSYSPFTNFLHRKIDKSASKHFNMTGPTIEEIDAPVVVNKQLSFAQIKAILDVDPSMTPGMDLENNLSKFTVNPAHCSKRVWILEDLPKNFEFSKLLELFNLIKWEEKYPLIKNPFFEDDNFLYYIKDCFRDADEEDIKARPEHYLNAHIQELNAHDPEKKITKETFLANRLREQMEILVRILSGEQRVKGSQKDLDESIQCCAQILDYLLKLNAANTQDRVIIEDILLKLGIEGGDYCARGVKRASDEIVTGISQQLASEDDDPINAYEHRLQFALEQDRTNIFNTIYQKIISAAVLSMKGKSITEVTDKDAAVVTEDVHTYDLYRLPLARGVVPLSKIDLQLFGLSELYNWELFRGIREDMYINYYKNIDDVIKEVGHAKFGTYINTIINLNGSLSETEKEEVLEIFTERNNDAWSFDSTQKRFTRLVCVMLGILEFKESIQDHWENIDPSSLPAIDENWEEVVKN